MLVRAHVKRAEPGLAVLLTTACKGHGHVQGLRDSDKVSRGGISPCGPNPAEVVPTDAAFLTQPLMGAALAGRSSQTINLQGRKWRKMNPVAAEHSRSKEAPISLGVESVIVAQEGTERT